MRVSVVFEDRNLYKLKSLVLMHSHKKQLVANPNIDIGGTVVVFLLMEELSGCKFQSVQLLFWLPELKTSLTYDLWEPQDIAT